MNNKSVEFYGVYLLYCKNVKYKGRTYIGYTVNPNRRIKQHNKGKTSGGAFRTNNKGPWEMVLIIHGFPNSISALRFEWAWQHPDISRRLRHVSKKKSSEKMYDFCLRVLSEMLQVGPWNRLALTIQWLKQEYAREFPPNKCPPLYMPIAYGPVNYENSDTSNYDSNSEEESVEENEIFSSKEVANNTKKYENVVIGTCVLCYKLVSSEEGVKCISPVCSMVSHIICLAQKFVSNNKLIPISGSCPSCEQHILWGEVISNWKKERNLNMSNVETGTYQYKENDE